MHRTRPYSVDFREFAVELYGRWQNVRRVAAFLHVSPASISRWTRRLIPLPPGRHPKPQNPEVLVAIKAFLASKPLSTVENVRSHLAEKAGITASRELVRLAVKNAGLTKKKARFHGPGPVPEEKISAFLQSWRQYSNEGRMFVSVDEVGFSANVAPLQGYAPKGERLRLHRKVTSAEKQNTSVVAAVCSRHGIIAHKESRVHYTRETFAAFLETLELPRGTVIVLDNLRAHHSIIVRELAGMRGWELLFTPPYSPWFNAIELVFAAVKRSYRKGMSIRASFDSVTNTAVARCCRHTAAVCQKLAVARGL